jgi:hypothetical protein
VTTKLRQYDTENNFVFGNDHVECHSVCPED